ncbi:MAG: AAA family ATPase [Acutalibacteraceae bacterium]|nr:AAA family ATPase [Acutalibacteraceae bacterium]
MKISNIKIENFRCFQNLSVKFDSQMNVIAGNNGAGKSSILDAVSVGVGSFLLGIEDVSAPGIYKSDVRFVSYEVGSVIDRQPQFPVKIECNGVVDNKQIMWTRQLNTGSGKTTYGDAFSIKDIASSMQNSIREGNNQTHLPIISYYGTGRLWAQKREKNNAIEKNLKNRLSGYIDCLSSMSNEKLMIKWFQKMTMQELQDGEKIPELTAVETAVSQCYQGSGIIANNVKVRFNIKSNELEITYLDEDGKKQKHPFHELSDGFKNTLSLVADIAYRMAVLNPQFFSDVTRKTTGVVIIDEIDQHLHPKWQKNILKNLMTIFPKVQFIVTTHSPSVISSAKKHQLIVLDDGNVHYYDDEIYGKDVNSVLSEIMEVNARPDDVELEFSKFYDYLEDEKYDKAREVLVKLSDLLGNRDNGVISATVALDFETDNG